MIQFKMAWAHMLESHFIRLAFFGEVVYFFTCLLLLSYTSGVVFFMSWVLTVSSVVSAGLILNDSLKDLRGEIK